MVIKYLVLLMLLFAGGLFCRADDNEVEIKGGFGYVLGEDGSKLKGTKINDDIIEQQAKSSFRNFTKCRIMMTEEKIIYCITSLAVYDSEKETDREYKIILNLLEKKYKATFTDVTSQRRNSDDKSVTPDQIFYTLERNRKNIQLRKYKKAIRIYYWDTDMNNAQHARKRRVSEQQSNNDTDAL